MHPVAAESLARLKDKHTIGGLVGLAFARPDRIGARNARRALEAVLPVLSAQDAGQFPQTLINELNGAVNRHYETEFIVTVLNALEVVGNGTSVQPVQRLVRRASTTRIYNTAHRVAEVLAARDARTRAAQNLLRGSHAPNAKQSELLRASQPESDKWPEQLLRPLADDSYGPQL